MPSNIFYVLVLQNAVRFMLSYENYSKNLLSVLSILIYKCIIIIISALLVGHLSMLTQPLPVGTIICCFNGFSKIHSTSLSSARSAVSDKPSVLEFLQLPVFLECRHCEFCVLWLTPSIHLNASTSKTKSLFSHIDIWCYTIH